MPTVLLQEIRDLLKEFFGTLNELLTNLYDSVQNIEDDVDDINTKLDALAQLVEIVNDISSLLVDVKNLLTSIDDNTDYLPLINTKVNEINLKIDTVNNTLTTISTNTGAIITPISLIKTNTDSLLVNSNQMKIGVAKIASYIDEIANNTGDLAASLDDIATNTLNIYNKVVTIASDTTDIRTKIGFIKDAIELIQPDVAAALVLIGNIDSTVTSILSDTGAIAADTNTIKTDVTYIKNNLPTTTAIENLLTQIEDDVDNVEGLLTSGNTARANILSNTTDIKSNTQPLSAISSYCNDIKTDVNFIRNDVTDINTDVNAIAGHTPNLPIIATRLQEIKNLCTTISTSIPSNANIENLIGITNSSLSSIDTWKNSLLRQEYDPDSQEYYDVGKLQQICNRIENIDTKLARIAPYNSFEKLQSQYQLWPSKIYTGFYRSSNFALAKDYQTGAGSGGSISAGQVMTLILGKCNTHGSTSRNDWSIEPIKLEGLMFSNSTTHEITAITSNIDIASDLQINQYFARQTVFNKFDMNYNLSILQQANTNHRILEVYRLFNFANNNTAEEPLSFWIAITFAPNSSTNTGAFDYHSIPNSAAEIKDTCDSTCIYTDSDNGKYNILNY